MLRPKDQPAYDRVRRQLHELGPGQGALPGLSDQGTIDSLAEQIVESTRRKEYLAYVRDARIDEISVAAGSDGFDPMRAAVYHHRQGNFDEAFWMLFLFAHFGKHRDSHWYYAQQVYAGPGTPWTWSRVVDELTGFRDWLEREQERIKQRAGRRGFGNHRKYESLSGWSDAGTGAVVASYVGWVGDTGSHKSRFPGAWDPRVQSDFDALYRSMSAVKRLGRLGRFDYLTTGARLGLINAVPRRLYLTGSTGPLAGARLLFDDYEASASALDARATEIADSLQVEADTFEDALCNWSKSPGVFRSFRG